MSARAAFAGLAVAATLGVCLGCGVPEPPEPTGGVTIDPTACGRGLVVVSSDYQSTNVALTETSGEVESESIISSGSAETGLSAPLSGDVVPTTQTAEGDAFVLVDRYPAAVLTWVDVASGEVPRQLAVGTGFAANPQDYVELDESRALVSRYEKNPDPGREAFDAGSDLLLLDPSVPEIQARIDLGPATDGADPSLLPRPSRMIVTADRVFVLLAMYASDFTSGPSRLAALDRETLDILEATELDGLEGCGGLALSPDRTRLAIACTGGYDGTSAPDLAHAGVALVRIEGGLELETTLGAEDADGRPPAYSVAWANDELLLVPTFGRLSALGDPIEDDGLVLWNLPASDAVVIAERPAFTLGEVRCLAACGACFLADASGAGALLRFAVDGERRAVTLGASFSVAPSIGLPPRTLGAY